MHLLDACKVGEFLFHYHKEMDYFVYKRPDNSNLLLYTTDKDLNIVSKEEIENSSIFYSPNNGIDWYRPTVKEGQFTVRGRLLGDEPYFFTMTNTNVEYEELRGSKTATFTYNLLNCMKHIDVTHAIQLQDTLFFVGKYITDDEVDYVFGEVDLVSDSMERYYVLSSDKGDCIPLALSLANRKISVVGYRIVDEQHVPYLENFLFNTD